MILSGLVNTAEALGQSCTWADNWTLAEIVQDHLLSGKCRYSKIVRKEPSGRRLDINFSIEVTEPVGVSTRPYYLDITLLLS